MITVDDVGTVATLMQQTGFEVRHVESLREHYPLTLRQWIANLEAEPQFTFHLKGPGAVADLPATARVITDDAERRAILPLVAAAWGRRDLETMVANSPLAEITLTEQPG